MENEVWRDVVGYEGLYQVSNNGRIRSLRAKTRIKDKQNGIMRQKIDQRGYYRVNLHKGGKCKGEIVSRLVALAFIPNPNNLPQVGHDDDNKTNNHVSNLYWTNASENLTHNDLHLRIRDKRQKNIQKVIDALSTPVIGTNVLTGETVFFPSMQEAERNGFSCAKISNVCAGKRKTHGSYYWRKVDG